MCGIAGFSLNPNSNIDARRLAAALLRAIEARGRDAAGLAWTDPDDGCVWYQKDNIPATRLIASLDVPAGARTLIAHTRWATKGSPGNPANNHPITHGTITGVHNGVIANDDAIFTQLSTRRRGQVDSEAIFALLAAGHDLPETAKQLRGSAAIAWLDERAPDLLGLARIDTSPLRVARTACGALLFASTTLALKEATARVGLSINREFGMREGAGFTVRHGQFRDHQTWQAPGRRRISAIERQAVTG